MSTSDPILILLAHNHWSTRKILDACASLSEEQFHQRFEMGLGSLHDTLTHILGAMRNWGDLLAGRPQRGRLEGGKRTVTELLMLLDELGADLQVSATAHPVNEEVTSEMAGESHTYTRGAVLTHLMTHGVHHRAQCVNMLRTLRVGPVPRTSVIEWVRMVDQAR